jgi:acyl-CoA reductase-like NAD-dependent aldehyde dehydrogenase
MGGLNNAGQDCTCGSRIYVQSSVYTKFLDIVKEKMTSYKIGDGSDPESSAGPLVRAAEAMLFLS